jgi:cytoskeletal protein CcmA (bactofilin family)
VELIAPARLYGDVDTPRLIVTEGVTFDGDCSMGVAKQKGGVTASQNLSTEKAVVAKTAKLQADFEK